jgi:uncharacterized damage-inducible protein DinB
MSLTKALIAELLHEANSTKKMLERIPADKLNWKPHEKSMSLGALASHVAELPHWITRPLAAPEFDLATLSGRRELNGSEEMLALYQKQIDEAIAALEAADEASLDETWTLRRGEHVVFSMPKKVAIRNMAMNHLVHHRGQLSVYLRLLDIPLPGVYGPSADER